MTTTFRHVRFRALPAYDIRACYGCGDDAGVPTKAYIDNVTGAIVHCFPGDVPSEDGPVHDPRQATLDLRDPAAEHAECDVSSVDDFDELEPPYSLSWEGNHPPRHIGDDDFGPIYE